MAKLNVRDANTGDFVEVELDNPSGTIYVNDYNTGGIIPVPINNSQQYYNSLPIGSVIKSPSNPDTSKFAPLDGRWVTRASCPQLSALIPNYQPDAALILSAPTSANYTRAVWGAGLWLIVRGTASSIYATSPDGVVWTDRSFPSSAIWKTVAYGGGLFVAIQSTGTSYATSANGIDWTPQTLPVSSTWSHIVWTGTAFALIGNASVLLTSTDGVNWTQLVAPAAAGSLFYYVDRLLYLPSSSTDGTFYISTNDGVNWTTLRCTIYSGAAVTTVSWNGSVYVGYYSAAGFATGVSSDGSNWTVVPFSSPMSRALTMIIWTGNYFIGFSNNNGWLVYSTDGLSWTDAPMNVINGGIIGWISYGNSQLIGLGFGKVVASNATPTRFYLPNVPSGMAGLKTYIRVDGPVSYP